MPLLEEVCNVTDAGRQTRSRLENRRKLRLCHAGEPQCGRSTLRRVGACEVAATGIDHVTRGEHRLMEGVRAAVG